jgi:hypothetical protein
MNVTAETYFGEKIRVKIGEAAKNEYGTVINDKEFSTGVSLVAVYIGRKWIIREFYSIWDNGKGFCVGTYYRAWNKQTKSKEEAFEIMEFCEENGLEVPASVESLVLEAN